MQLSIASALIILLVAGSGICLQAYHPSDVPAGLVPGVTWVACPGLLLRLHGLALALPDPGEADGHFPE